MSMAGTTRPGAKWKTCAMYIRENSELSVVESAIVTSWLQSELM